MVEGEYRETTEEVGDQTYGEIVVRRFQIQMDEYGGGSIRWMEKSCLWSMVHWE